LASAHEIKLVLGLLVQILRKIIEIAVCAVDQGGHHCGIHIEDGLLQASIGVRQLGIESRLRLLDQFLQRRALEWHAGLTLEKQNKLGG
jgi:hypothetical protein